MEDLSLHILDIAENSVRAGATRVEISVVKDEIRGFLVVAISDNGAGLGKEEVEKVFNPFFTSRKERRVGLGLPLWKQAAEECEGGVEIVSNPGSGTKVVARFKLGHIDLKPLGDLGATLSALVSGWPDVDFFLTYAAGGRDFLLDTAEIRTRLGGTPIQDPAVLGFIRRSVAEGVSEVERSG